MAVFLPVPDGGGVLETGWDNKGCPCPIERYLSPPKREAGMSFQSHCSKWGPNPQSRPPLSPDPRQTEHHTRVQSSAWPTPLEGQRYQSPGHILPMSLLAPHINPHRNDGADNSCYNHHQVRTQCLHVSRLQCAIPGIP